MAGVSPAQAASHPAPSHLTATAKPLTVLTHNTVVISGVVSPRGTGVVTLQRYSAGKWIQVSQKPTSKTGSYSFGLHTSGTVATTIYRVTRAASSTAKAVVSKTMHVNVVKTAYKVKAAAASSSVVGGTPIVVTGSVTPKAKGTVLLEILLHGVWHDIASAKLSSASTYSLKMIEPTGVYALRVRSPLTATIASGVSPSVKVTVTTPTSAAPTASVSLAGTATSPGVYSGAVTATAHTTAVAGVKSITYSLDGATAKPYAAAVSVSTAGSHSFKVTVTDLAGRVATATANWAITPTQVDTQGPSATIALSGTAAGASTYTGSVTATVTATASAAYPVKSVTYSLDGGAQTPYTGPILVGSPSSHVLNVTVTDQQNRVGTAAASWTQTASADAGPPVIAVTLIGNGSGGVYTGDVQVQATTTGGAGPVALTYLLDSATQPTTYTGIIIFTGTGTHTITFSATDGVHPGVTANKAWSQSPGATPALVVSSSDQTTLGEKTARLAFSTYNGGGAVPARSFTFTNTTGSPIQVSGLAITGTDASSFRLASGQDTSFAIPANDSANVRVEFHPAAPPTGCPDDASPYAISPDANRTATLAYSTNVAAQPSGTADLSGLDACGQGGNAEPVLDQVLSALGYTDHTANGFGERRYIGPSRLAVGDEIQSPYFTAVNPAIPVTLVPVAHYGAPTTSPSEGYQNTGWYARGAALNQPSSTCPIGSNSPCKKLWNFPPDPSTTVYNENQKLLPTPTGGTTFTPTGAFGVFSSEFSDVNFTDDALNLGNQNDATGHANQPLPVPHHLHDIRVFPAYGPNRVLIPNSYLLTIDVNRVPAYKNNDFQDVVLLLSNVAPATGPGRVVSSSNDSVDLTSSTVGANCSVSGFDGVLAASGAAVNPCNQGNIGTSAAGLVLTSSSGQLADHNQQNALYQTFDATRGAFTISTRVQGSTDQLQNNYQQIGAFFGPDDNNFIKIEAEHNGVPGLTLFYDENGHSSSAASVEPAGLTSSSTLDLVIKGNTSVPDPITGAADSYAVHGFPLDELTVWYSINDGPLTQIVNPVTGLSVEFPANVSGWFSRQARAGILVSSPQDSTPGAPVTGPITATFSRFSIAAG
jgi:hypothetical protein